MDITWLGDNSFKISDEIIDVVVNPAKNLESSLISDKTFFTSSLAMIFTPKFNFQIIIN